MSLQKGQRIGNNGNHGAKGRSGRKPSAYTILKSRIESEKANDAERAFALYVAVMDNPDEPTHIRLAAAAWICDRVLGKPKEHRDLAGNVTLRVVYDSNRIDGTPTGAA